MIRIGPAALVTAAFIGPGTVTTCFLAGTNFGYALLWALIFATLATITLQEMAARLGAGAGLGLGEALMQSSERPALRWAVACLLLTALAVGNAAYEGGNLAGGAMGAVSLTGGAEGAQRPAVLLLAGLAAMALARGSYEILERVLVSLVVVMSIAFLAALVLGKPDLGGIVSGLRPRLPEGSVLTATALIGTTIVPYNLFLHAAAARRKFEGPRAVNDARADTVVAVALGGAVSCAILLVAAAADPGEGAGRNLADALEPALGPAGGLILAVGLLAAGLTSAITAPMATGFVLSEIVGGSEARKRFVFKAAAFTVLIVGALAALLGFKPVALIVVAQAANGILLPVVAVYLLSVMNRRALLGPYTNGLVSNVLGFTVVAVALFLGGLSIGRVIGVVG